MYKEIPGGSVELIDDGIGGHFTCYLPPLPEKHKIAGYNLPKKEQKWKRTELPSIKGRDIECFDGTELEKDKFYSWEEATRQEEIKRTGQDTSTIDSKGQYKTVSGVEADEYYLNPILERFRLQEWARRIHGFWFMNNGKPTYLTGSSYMYLNWTFLENIYPKYFDLSRQNFYCLEHCWQNPKSLGYLELGSRGFGKCNSRGTKVLMYKGGFKKVEDVVVGDLLMGPDSKPRRVLSTTSGIGDLYTVQQNKGIHYTVNSEHVISLRRNKGITSYPQYRQIANIPVKELLNKTASFFSSFSGYRVAVEFTEKELPIPPYLLGTWLGDGTTADVQISTPEKEIVAYWKSYAESKGLYLTQKQLKDESKRIVYHISNQRTGIYKNEVLDLFRDNGFLGNKHIPDNYLFNSKENRLQLLAGLLDTDGYYKAGCYTICQKKESLIDSIKTLCDTLGFKCTKREMQKSIKSIGFTGTYYELCIGGYIDEIPVLVPRKKATCNKNKNPFITRINKIEPVGVGEFFGFELDGDHLYLLEDCTVTHNSTEKLAFMLDKITQPPYNRKAYIQSKTEDDAKLKQFQGKLVPMFNKYPSFFKPKNNHGSNPKNGFSFFRDTLRGKSSKGVSFEGGEELGNTLIPINSGVLAMDGETVSIAFCDEIGKTIECDVFQRHQTNRETVYRSAVGKTGIILAASTVEEMEKGGGKACKKVWDASDRNKTMDDGSGFTVSGMDRRFVPCWKCAFDPELGFLDEYGMLDEEGAKVYFNKELLSAKRDSQEAYLKRLRMYPMRIEDCFISPNASSPFAVYVINSRLRELNEQNNIMRFNFRWENNVRFSRAIVEHDENGCWASSWLKMDKEQTNLVAETDARYIQGQEVRSFRPLNDVKFRMGMDPIDHKDTVDARSSRPVAFVKRLFDHNEDDPNAVYTLADCNGDEKDYKLNKAKWNSNRYVAWFDKRLDDPNDIYEQIMLGCWYFGCQVHVENQKRSIINYFNNQGHSDFVMFRPQETFTMANTRQNTEGTPGVNPVIDQYINMIATYVVNFGHLIDCIPLLEDLRDFERKNIRFHDYVVAMGFTEMASLGTARQNTKPVEVADLFRMFNNSGEQSSLASK